MTAITKEMLKEIKDIISAMHIVSIDLHFKNYSITDNSALQNMMLKAKLIGSETVKGLDNGCVLTIERDVRGNKYVLIHGQELELVNSEHEEDLLHPMGKYDGTMYGIEDDSYELTKEIETEYLGPFTSIDFIDKLYLDSVDVTKVTDMSFYFKYSSIQDIYFNNIDFDKIKTVGILLGCNARIHQFKGEIDNSPLYFDVVSKRRLALMHPVCDNRLVFRNIRMSDYDKIIEEIYKKYNVKYKEEKFDDKKIYLENTKDEIMKVIDYMTTSTIFYHYEQLLTTSIEDIMDETDVEELLYETGYKMIEQYDFYELVDILKEIIAYNECIKTTLLELTDGREIVLSTGNVMSDDMYLDVNCTELKYESVMFFIEEQLNEMLKERQ